VICIVSELKLLLVSVMIADVSSVVKSVSSVMGLLSGGLVS